MTDTTPSTNPARAAWIRAVLVVLAIAGIAGGLVYWRTTMLYVYTDSASVEAPLIQLAPTHAGILQEVYVHEGDEITADTPVARVGNELVKSKVAGVVVSVPETLGAPASAGVPVVSMVDSSQLRVAGKIDEDKGLSRIAIGDRVAFAVDAFGSRQYTGVVDEIAPSANQSGVVFNISDKREVKQFIIKVRYDVAAHPELKNGMSARIWIYTQ